MIFPLKFCSEIDEIEIIDYSSELLECSSTQNFHQNFEYPGTRYSTLESLVITNPGHNEPRS